EAGAALALAGVAADRAPVGRAALGRGVRHRVAAAAAAALERVIEAGPVAHLVGGGVALVVRRGPAARQRAVEDDHAVAARVGRVPVGEGRPAEQAAARVGDVEVEVLGAALAQGRLHLRLGRGVGAGGVPAIVGGDVGGRQREREAGAGERVVQHLDLAVDLTARDRALAARGGDDVDVDGDRRAGEVAAA